MKEHTTKQLKRDTLVKLSDGTMAVIRDNEPSVKRKVEMMVEGKPQLVVIESYRIVSVSIKGKGWPISPILTKKKSDKHLSRNSLSFRPTPQNPFHSVNIVA